MMCKACSCITAVMLKVKIDCPDLEKSCTSINPRESTAKALQLYPQVFRFSLLQASTAMLSRATVAVSISGLLLLLFAVQLLVFSNRSPPKCVTGSLQARDRAPGQPAPAQAAAATTASAAAASATATTASAAAASSTRCDSRQADARSVFAPQQSPREPMFKAWKLRGAQGIWHICFPRQLTYMCPSTLDPRQRLCE